MRESTETSPDEDNDITPFARMSREAQRAHWSAMTDIHRSTVEAQVVLGGYVGGIWTTGFDDNGTLVPVALDCWCAGTRYPVIVKHYKDGVMLSFVWHYFDDVDAALDFLHQNVMR